MPSKQPSKQRSDPPERHVRGTPPKYIFWITQDGLAAIAGWTRLGLVARDIAVKCGVSSGTFSDWRKRFPEIDKAIRENEGIANAKVINALFQRATGYDFEEKRTVTKKTPNGNVVEVHSTTKHIPPDVGAQAFWLKNRDRDNWKNEWDAEHATGEVEDLAPLARLLKLEDGDGD